MSETQRFRSKVPDLALPGWWVDYRKTQAESKAPGNLDPFRIMRPHWESAVSDETEQAWRKECDRWLERVAMVELLVATGNIELAEVRPALDPCLNALVHPAVQRYLDDYDYFSARFLLARLGDVRGFLPPLPIPPYPLTVAADISKFREQQTRFEEDPEIEKALNILDDFVYGPSIHKTALRKWLEMPLESRGPSEDLAKVAKHLTLWIKGKAETYSHASSAKVCARYAIFDFFWLSQLFECAISTMGQVRWNAEPGARDWFDLLDIEPASKTQLRDAWVLACQWIQGRSQETSADSSLRFLGKEEAPQIASTPLVTWADVRDSIYYSFSLLGKRLKGASLDA